MSHDNKNIMVILSSPSGAGKTTISKKILQKLKSFKLSVSLTTRPPRSNEVEGIDYYFTTKEKFKKLIFEKKLYEHAKIFDNYYGTLKKEVDQSILKNDIIFDIDWQGTKQLSEYPNLNLIKIFLITQDKMEIKNRLIERNQNTAKEIQKRFKSFENDVTHWKDYDYIVINKNLNVCFNQIEKIILNEKKNSNFFQKFQ